MSQDGLSEDILIDIAQLREMSGGDVAFEGELLHAYYADLEQRLNALHAAMQSGDQESWHRITHAIKGSSATAGLIALRDLAEELESMDVNLHLALMKPALTQLETLASQTRSYLCEQNIMPV